ncbi:MAG TPA: zinc-binding dehydrogenase [Gemmatimonadales bacterium]|nr:zinc-binding dehydrogenase [Gemmatimonadales bacterium]
MRALVLTGTGGLDRLTVADVPVPELRAPDDVRVRVRAAALNRLDLFVAQGLPNFRCPFPHVVGSDGAGVVEAVGPAVADLAPGDRVMLNPGVACLACEACRAGEHPLCERFQILGEHRAGTAAEYVVVPARNVARVPAHMPWERAAAFSLATLTAWRMLTTRARLAAPETVLIWGIGGGVAQAALAIAKLLGATAIVTSSSDAKLAPARAAGADHTINHATADVAAEVRRLTGGRGAHVVVDSVGERTWPTSLRCLRRAGRLVTCGGTTGPMVGLDVRKLFWHQWSILGSTMGSYAEYGEITTLAGRGLLWPTVDTVVPLAEGVEAFRRLASGAQHGKLVIEVA